MHSFYPGFTVDFERCANCRQLVVSVRIFYLSDLVVGPEYINAVRQVDRVVANVQKFTVNAIYFNGVVGMYVGGVSCNGKSYMWHVFNCKNRQVVLLEYKSFYPLITYLDSKKTSEAHPLKGRASRYGFMKPLLLFCSFFVLAAVGEISYRSCHEYSGQSTDYNTEYHCEGE